MALIVITKVKVCILFYKSFRPSTRNSSFWISSTSNENSLDVIGTWSGIVKPVEKVTTYRGIFLTGPPLNLLSVGW